MIAGATVGTLVAVVLAVSALVIVLKKTNRKKIAPELTNT